MHPSRILAHGIFGCGMSVVVCLDGVAGKPAPAPCTHACKQSCVLYEIRISGMTIRISEDININIDLNIFLKLQNAVYGRWFPPLQNLYCCQEIQPTYIFLFTARASAAKRYQKVRPVSSLFSQPLPCHFTESQSHQKSTGKPERTSRIRLLASIADSYPT